MYLVHSFMRQIALTPLLPQIMKWICLSIEEK
jgi:hypothetical protein